MTLALSLAYALPDPHPPADVEPEHDARQAPLYLVWSQPKPDEEGGES